MKIHISENIARKYWENKITHWNPFKDNYVTIHHNKIINIKIRNVLRSNELTNEIDFDLNRYKQGIYIISTVSDGKKIILNAKLNILKYWWIKFLKVEFPTPKIELNIILFSLISGIIGFIIGLLINC